MWCIATHNDTGRSHQLQIQTEHHLQQYLRITYAHKGVDIISSGLKAKQTLYLFVQGIDDNEINSVHCDEVVDEVVSKS